MDLLSAASDELERVVAALPDGAWDRATPCDVTVRELLEHVVAGNLFSALLVSGRSRSEALRVRAGDHLGDDPLAAVRSSARAQYDAFATADPEAPLQTPVGEVSTATFRWFRIGDLVVHAWDLARGAGLEETLDPDVVAGLWELTAPHLEWMRTTGTFGAGASADLPADVPLQRRLLDAYGRRP